MPSENFPTLMIDQLCLSPAHGGASRRQPTPPNMRGGLALLMVVSAVFMVAGKSQEWLVEDVRINIYTDTSQERNVNCGTLPTENAPRR